MKKIISIGLCAFILTGCSNQGHRSSMKLDIPSNQFEAQLFQNYKELSKKEYSSADFKDANFFGKKMHNISEGIIGPQTITERKIPNNRLNDLIRGHTELSAYINDEMKQDGAKPLANAISSFDCWIEEQEENINEEDIKKCRNEFDFAIDQLRSIEENKLMETISLETREYVEPQNIKILFDLKSTDLNDDAKTKLAYILTEADRVPSIGMEIKGYADTSGNQELNKKISKIRAENVMNYLIQNGVNSEKITIESFGENAVAIETGDGVRQAENRRVEVRLY